MKKPVKICETCGAKIVEYKHGLSTDILRGFYKAVARAGRSRVFEIGECKLSYSQRENIRKLQYWGFIAKHGDNPKGGQWQVLDAGIDFLMGKTSAQQSVWTYRGVVQRFEGRFVTVGELTGGWKYRPDYAREAVPHPPP